MVRGSMGRVKRMLQWGKIFLPRSSLRYYPPQFILRNPVLAGVRAAFNGGHDVAVIVFTIKNLEDLAIQLGPVHYPQYINTIKKYFQLAVEQEILTSELISLNVT